jgi:hypothetical protein
MGEPRPDEGDCGTFPMQPAQTEAKYLKIGFEYGCSSPATHLGLRFEGQPSSGVDGKPFPADAWERSAFFRPKDFPLEVAGIKDPLDTRSLEAAFSEDVCAAEDRPPPSIEPEVAWRQVVLAAAAVTARWFVLHDTGGGPAATAKNPLGRRSQARGVHLFVGPSSACLNRDFSVAGSATRFEQLHHEFRGKMIHCELENLSAKRGTPPADPYTEFQYRAAALAYVFASYRAGEWLTVAAHISVDLGIPGGHEDPRGFDYGKLHRLISAMVGVQTAATYGLLADPTGKNSNEARYINTFPAQYGPPQEATVKAQASKAKKRR